MMEMKGNTIYFRPASVIQEEQETAAQAISRESAERIRDERLARHSVLFNLFATTQYEIVLVIQAIATFRPDDIYEQDDAGRLRLKPYDEWTERGKLAMQSFKFEENFVRAMGEDGEVMSRKEEIRLHDKLKAASLLIDLFKMLDNPDFRKASQAINQVKLSPLPLLDMRGNTSTIDVDETIESLRMKEMLGE